MKKTLSSDVEITLDGQIFHLRSSLKAANAVSNHFGGFIAAYQHIANASLQAFQYIIRQGIPKAELDDLSTDDLNHLIWATGTNKLVGPVSKYITRLQNGGRDPEDEDEKKVSRDEDDEGNGEI